MKESNEVKNDFFIKPYSSFWGSVKSSLLYAIFINILLMMLTTFRFNKENKIFSIINNILDLIPEKFTFIFIGIIIICIILYIYISKTKDKFPDMDEWAPVIIRNHLRSTGLYYKGNTILCNYDVSLNQTNGIECCRELSDKSNNFIYFFQYVDIDQNVMAFEVSEKQAIPTKCSVDTNNDNLWNFVPLGKSVNNEKKSISDIGWYINDNNIDEESLKTLPSTSFLVCGATGGGKSVLQNGILGHVSRHSENFQMCGIDMKQVEFNNFIGIKGVKKIGLSIEEGADIVKQARDMMNERYTFMRNQKKNNIYNVENVEVDYFELNGKKYQFDEMFPCILLEDDLALIDKSIKSESNRGIRNRPENNEENKFVSRLLTIDKIYQLLENDVEIIIDESYCKI